MKFYTTMPESLTKFYQQELENAKMCLAKKDLKTSWKYLERAHILGQPYPIAHSKVHWKMFLFGIRIKNTKEIIGQIPRLVFGGVKSFVGKIPIGNTGGANVHPLLPMTMPNDLQIIIKQNT